MKLTIALVVVLVLLPEISNAATEYATFQSFYRQSSWLAWVVGAIAAVIAGALIIFTGGTASPIVVSVGTWVGGLMGFSGIAATNAGLALLGGGSIATGGFGIIGGTVLLTAAFSFGNAVVIDFAVGKAVNRYEQSKFVEESKNMTTLPLPKNTAGPDSYEAALKVLKKVNAEEPLSGIHNQSVIRDAIQKIGIASNNELSPAKKSREQSLLSLLHFISNDYVAAKKHAVMAYRLALNANVKATLPAFIYATSSLYDERPDFKRATEFFEYAVTNEIDNPITPLLFAVYLDRMMYRFNDGYLSSASLNNIYNLSTPLFYDERKAAIQTGLLSRYFIRIKIEQQKILSLTSTSNKTIKDSSKTLLIVQGALKEYKLLLTGTRHAISQQSSHLRLESDLSTIDKATGKGIKEWETQWSSRIGEMWTLWSSYSVGLAGLEGMARGLENYQSELEQTRLGKMKPGPVSQVKNRFWWPYVFMMFTVLLIYLFRRSGAKR